MDKKNYLYMFLACIIFISSSILILSCSIPFQKQEKIQNIKIGISVYDEYDTFIAEMIKQVTQICKDKEKDTGVAITLDIVSAAGSQMTQNDQIERFADKKYDAVCVNLVDRTDASTIIDKARSVNMPVVFFNRELVEEDLERWDKLYYVGAIAEESGRMQGEIVLDACENDFASIDKNGDKKLQYIMLEGEAGHQDALIRTQKSIETIVNGGYEVDKLDSVIANWNREQAVTKMFTLLERYPYQIEVILANNDDMALGAIDAYVSNGITNIPLIVGVNGEEEALEMVLSKKMEGTVFNNAYSQAKAIVEIAYASAVGEKIPDSVKILNGKYVYLPYTKINYHNAQQFLNN